jgi:hypothetical protein
MRTKTLLIAAAALAATVISSEAQTPVYSANIVGYTAQVLAYNGSANNSHGWANVSPTLDQGADSLTNLFPNPGSGGSGPLDFDKVYVWNGSGYTTYTLDTDYASGVGDQNDNDNVEPYAPLILPGTLVFILNNGGNVSIATTNFLSGTVHVDTTATGSETIGQTTNILVRGLNYVASKLPVSGGLNTALQLQQVAGGDGGGSGGTGQLDFSLVYVPNIANGNFTGYTTYTVDSDYVNGYGDQNDNDTLAGQPQCPAGAGIIIDYLDANSGGDGLGTQTTYKWIQKY